MQLRSLKAVQDKKTQEPAQDEPLEGTVGAGNNPETSQIQDFWSEVSVALFCRLFTLTDLLCTDDLENRWQEQQFGFSSSELSVCERVQQAGKSRENWTHGETFLLRGITGWQLIRSPAEMHAGTFTHSSFKQKTNDLQW